MDNIFSNIGKYADAGKKVEIAAESHGDTVKLTFRNAVKKDISESESNHIGIKTCVRIMEQMCGSFDVESDPDSFTVALSLPVEDMDGKGDL